MASSYLPTPLLALLLSIWACSPLATRAQWIDYPADGTATLTTYSLPENYIAACGCTAASTHYPTAAMSQMAYGSSMAYGPACGRCFNITLLNTFESDPPFFPDVHNSVIVKITDLCPVGGNGWCSATSSKPNQGGAYINFDLAFPSNSIPDDFFPSNVSEYGYASFGVWNVSYSVVDCLDTWSGTYNQAALGSVDDGSSVCCPANPSGNDTCPSYSLQNGIPPDTQTSQASSASPAHIPSLDMISRRVLIALIAFALFGLLS